MNNQNRHLSSASSTPLQVTTTAEADEDPADGGNPLRDDPCSSSMPRRYVENVSSAGDPSVPFPSIENDVARCADPTGCSRVTAAEVHAPLQSVRCSSTSCEFSPEKSGHREENAIDYIKLSENFQHSLNCVNLNEDKSSDNFIENIRKSESENSNLKSIEVSEVSCNEKIRGNADLTNSYSGSCLLSTIDANALNHDQINHLFSQTIVSLPQINQSSDCFGKSNSSLPASNNVQQNNGLCSTRTIQESENLQRPKSVKPKSAQDTAHNLQKICEILNNTRELTQKIININRNIGLKCEKDINANAGQNDPDSNKLNQVTETNSEKRKNLLNESINENVSNLNLINKLEITKELLLKAVDQNKICKENLQNCQKENSENEINSDQYLSDIEEEELDLNENSSTVLNNSIVESNHVKGFNNKTSNEPLNDSNILNNEESKHAFGYTDLDSKPEKLLKWEFKNGRLVFSEITGTGKNDTELYLANEVKDRHYAPSNSLNASKQISGKSEKDEIKSIPPQPPLKLIEKCVDTIEKTILLEFPAKASLAKASLTGGYSEKDDIAGVLYSKDLNKKLSEGGTRLKHLEQKLKEAGLTDLKVVEQEYKVKSENDICKEKSQENISREGCDKKQVADKSALTLSDCEKASNCEDTSSVLCDQNSFAEKQCRRDGKCDNDDDALDDEDLIPEEIEEVDFTSR